MLILSEWLRFAAQLISMGFYNLVSMVLLRSMGLYNLVSMVLYCREMELL